MVSRFLPATAQLAGAPGTLVVFMDLRQVERIAAGLIALVVTGDAVALRRTLAGRA